MLPKRWQRLGRSGKKLVGVGIYVKNSPKAVELYKEVFGLELGYHVLNDDNTYFQYKKTV